MLKRSIYLDDPFELTIEEKVFRAAKVTCVVFAGAALTLSALDLMKVKSVETASEFIRSHRVADIPHVLRAGLTSIASAEPSPYVTVAIPRGNIALGPVPPSTHDAKMRAALEHDLSAADSPVAALADAPYQDAVEVALDAPPVPALAKPPRMQLASLERASPDNVDQAAKIDQAKTDQAESDQPKTDQPKAIATADAALSSATQPTPASPPAAGLVKLASLDPGDVLQAGPPAPPPISLPSQIAVLPRPAPPMSPAQRLHLVGKSRQRAENCLARAIYFEARDQPYRGQVAVAQVVMNRVFSGVYPRDVCGVIYQNAHRHLACQFTFACDGKPDIITERRPWYRAERIARKTLDGKLYVRAVGTATHYHATYVHPYWVREMRRYAREGIHLFYRPRAWGNGANEPIWSSAELSANEYYRRRR